MNDTPLTRAQLEHASDIAARYKGIADGCLRNMGMSPSERILRRILQRTDKPGRVRRFLIAIIFPEFRDILGDLHDLCDHLKF